MSGWGLALRVARREAWRNKKRSILVVAMLALPVAGAAAADTLWRSSQVTAEQKAAWNMGRYDALVTDTGTPMYQTPDMSGAGPVRDTAGNSPAPGRTAPETAAGLAALLPAGSQVGQPETLGHTQVQVTNGTSRAWGLVRDTDLGDPLLASTADRVSGAVPAAPDQVTLSSALAGRLHKTAGDTVGLRTTDPVTGAVSPVLTVHVSGIYDSKSDPYGDVLFVRPGIFGPRQTGGAGAPSQATFPISVPGGVDWTLTKQLNAQGFTVQSKRLLADPPPRSQVPYYQFYAGHTDGSNNAQLAVVAIALSMILLEVVLLAGPAFAVSARRRRRDFGLLGAAGADGRRLRRIVLADGVVLGAAGGVLGAVVGIVASAAALPWFGHYTQQALGGFRLRPLELAGSALVGVGTGVAAAVAPAITTARQDVLTALTGRRGAVSTPWKLPLIGLAGVLAGSVLIVFGAWHGGQAVTITVIIGIVLAELGMVACTPLIVTWSGRLARVLPLTGRLALRDGARNRGRTAPALAAIMAAVAGASAVAMVINSDDAQSRRYYQSQLRMGQAVAQLDDGNSGVAGAVADRLVKQIVNVLPTSMVAILQGIGFGDGQTPVPAPDIVRAPGNMCPDHLSTVAQAKDPRCSLGQSGRIQFLTGSTSVVSGGPDLVRALLGRDDPAAEAMLKTGGAVVFDKYDLATTGARPTVHLAISGTCDHPTTCAPQDDKQATLPAALVDSPRADVSAIVAPGALDKFGVKFAPMAALFDTTRMPTTDEEQRADDLVAATGISESFYVERGYQSQTWAGMLALGAVAGVVMLGAAAVATGLAITDAQNDLETLAAVGARPRVRRTLAASQAAVTAGLGAVLGAAFGLLPAVGLIEAKAQQIDSENLLSTQQTQFAPPWLYLGVVVVALPVLAAIGAAALTRSRIEMRRRHG